MKTLQNKLAEVRAALEALADEREEIAAAPIPRAEAEARIAAVVDAPYSDQWLSPEPAGLTDGSFNALELQGIVQRPALICAVIPGQIKLYLIALYDAQIGDHKLGLPAAERRKRLVEINARIFELEADEELTIESMEAEGTFILRRAEANPVAQLGLDRSAGEAA